MFTDLVMFSGRRLDPDQAGRWRSGRYHLPAGAADESACGRPGVPCRFSVEDVIGRGGSDCPLVVGFRDGRPANQPVDPQLLSLTVASLLLLGCVVGVAI